LSTRRRAEPAAREQVTLEFKKNTLMPALAGAHGRHLVRLEQKLGVRIATRGNLFSIAGDEKARMAAAAVLNGLYARLEAGEDVTSADVDAEIRFVSEPRDIGKPKQAGDGAIKTASGKITRARSAAQAAYMELMRTHDLVFGIGPAGTGKTFLAAAMGAHLLYERRVERLILARPALEAGERIGFLPGTLEEKVDPYLRPLYDALLETIGESYTKLIENDVIEVVPLAFMRGRTLSRAFIILDEAQNCTPGQMKMCLTRMGEDSRMVITGDPSQSDLPKGPEGLTQALDYLSGIDGIAVARFSEADVVRHALVTRIVGAYAEREGGRR
jgi:phosphate starvation-inducible PhoH-like protein